MSDENNSAIDIDALWSKACDVLKKMAANENDVNQMARYFSIILSKKIIGTELLVGLREEVAVNEFKSRYQNSLEHALHLMGLPEEIKLCFVVDDTVHEKPVAPKKPAVETTHPTPQAAKKKRGMPSTLPLDENYTFDNFVCGPCNSFAHAAAQAVVKGPGKTGYNPLFIYGGTGLGKTHLMHAIGHKILEKNPDASICYITTETFMNEYINSIVNQSGVEFRNRYRKVDVLLVDDVQFMAGKSNFQEEFFNTFNSLMIYQKQVVLTSDVAPRDLQGLEDRITSRFSSGMVVEIESPSYETRMAILKSKAMSLSRPIPESVLQYIAENIRSHVRALEGALQKVVQFSELNNNTPLDTEMVQKLLKDSIDEEQTIKDLTVDEIIKVVAEFYQISEKDIKSEGRMQPLATARQMAMFLARSLTLRSLQDIGTVFERNHSTVVHGSQAIKKRIDTEPELKNNLEAIIGKLGRKLSDVLKAELQK